MKVLCIEDSSEFMHTRNGKFTAPFHLRVFSGEYYTVIKEVVGYRGELKWVLSEKPSNCRYLKKYFAPLSEIDEVELSKNREKEYA